ncbi:MAG: hypothetical protein QXN63_01490 [Candidatus Bathyarchaeia archaeon]
MSQVTSGNRLACVTSLWSEIVVFWALIGKWGGNPCLAGEALRFVWVGFGVL